MEAGRVENEGMFFYGSGKSEVKQGEKNEAKHL